MTRPYSFQREILLILEEKLHIFHVQVRNNLILVLHVKKFWLEAVKAIAPPVHYLFDLYLIVNKLAVVGFYLTTLTLILKTERGL